MTHITKILIGGAAGVCLVLVKLIQVGFYVSKPADSGEVMGGLLTAGAFVAISMIFSPFLDETNPRKLFLQALAAPSFLLASVGPGLTPPLGETGPSRDEIGILPEVSLLLPFVVHAQEQDSQTQPRSSIEIETLQKGEFQGSLADGARRFVGRMPVTPHAFIIGRSSEAAHAKAIAKIYQDLLGGETIRLLQPEGSDQIYLAIGDLGDSQAVAKQKEEIVKHVELNDESDLKYAESLIRGQVVSLRKLMGVF